MSEREQQLAEQVGILRAEIRELKGRLDGDPIEASSWLQIKVNRQRAALDRLNRKVLTQRFRLRLLAELGRDVTAEEYLAARDRLSDSQVKGRIADYELVG